ncbi:NUDIX hydrolase [Jeotgalibacillus soli]|uniref:Nudix hydrolase domain-containing protein n=1 Tax=Jeotgalibacillus soli TaxID=889306 RepID=A0A0C2W5N5_9BACL|nr:NUDIX domain-containing protein [Jeotgalibacillus soli]KIL51891.1 hypothetical protein KP78_02610 [Jeotgalibacillus soli]
MFIVNVEAAVLKDGKWLIVKRSAKEEHAGGMLALVGGKVDIEGFSSDILERTIVREVAEEVGIQIKKYTQYIHSTTFVTELGENVVDIVFLCQHEAGEAFAKSPDEVDEVMWLTTEEILNEETAPDYLKESIKRADQLRRTRSC